MVKLFLPVALMMLPACMKGNAENLNPSRSFLYGSEQKTLFNCTEPGIAGAGWYVAWTTQGLADFYGGVHPGAVLSEPQPMRFVDQYQMFVMASALPGPEASCQSLDVEKWSGANFGVVLRLDRNTKKIEARAYSDRSPSGWECESLAAD